MEEGDKDETMDEDKIKTRPLVKSLNQMFICPICRGYLIDATTLQDCPHSFCRGCIVKKLKNGSKKSCPVCGGSVSTPLAPDVTLQKLVYMAIPGLFRSEQERRSHFRNENSQDLGVPIGAPKLTFDDPISLSINQIDWTLDKKSIDPKNVRYLKCPAGVAMRHLVRLLMLKRGLDDDGKGVASGTVKIEILYEVTDVKAGSRMEILDPGWTLLDLSYIYDWTGESPMRLLYRICKVDEIIKVKSPIAPKVPNSPTTESITKAAHIPNTLPSHTQYKSSNSASNTAIENMQRPPTPPPSPKPAITRTNSLDKTSKHTTIIDYSKEPKKPRCEVTPVLRSPDPSIMLPPPHLPPPKSVKTGKIDHHKRKKRKNKRVIGEITSTDEEDLLKLKVRLTPCPPRITYNTVSSQAKEKLMQMRAVRREKDRVPSSVKNGPISPQIKGKLEEKINSIVNNKSSKKEIIDLHHKVNNISKEEPNNEPNKNEDLLRKLGLVSVDEAQALQEKSKNANKSDLVKPNNAADREKLEKQLRDSKANRVRSLLAEKQMRDALKSIMSNTKDESSPTTGSPTNSNTKKKDPPPLTPLRNNSKKPSVTFAPNNSYSKNESPLDLSNASKDGVLDLSEIPAKIIKAKPTGILRHSLPNKHTDRPKEERKSQDLNLKTLSDAAVSLIDDRIPHKIHASQRFVHPSLGKVALRIPQPYQRITGFGMNKFKQNSGVRHIPNPQAVVASQYRNQKAGFYSLQHHPP